MTYGAQWKLLLILLQLVLRGLQRFERERCYCIGLFVLNRRDGFHQNLLVLKNHSCLERRCKTRCKDLVSILHLICGGEKR